jgi:hypothetical protein
MSRTVSVNGFHRFARRKLCADFRRRRGPPRTGRWSHDGGGRVKGRSDINLSHSSLKKRQRQEGSSTTFAHRISMQLTKKEQPVTHASDFRPDRAAAQTVRRSRSVVLVRWPPRKILEKRKKGKVLSPPCRKSRSGPRPAVRIPRPESEAGGYHAASREARRVALNPRNHAFH